MYIHRTDEKIPHTQSKVTRGRGKDEESFAETMDTVLTADAVEVTYSKKEDKDDSSNNLAKKKSRRRRTKESETDNEGAVNITA